MINDRLIRLIDLLNRNPNSFAQDLSLSPSIIYNIIGRRKSKPSFEVLEKIKQVYPQVDMNALVSGNGELLLNSTDNVDVSAQIKNLTNRIQQIETLAVVRDRYIDVLQNKIDLWKEDQGTETKRR